MDLNNIAEFSFWRDVAAVTGIIAGVLGGVSVIHAKFISPWIAKPLIKGIKAEIAEVVQHELASTNSLNILKGMLVEVMQSSRTDAERELAEIKDSLNKLLTAVTNLKGRMTKIENQLKIENTEDSLGVHRAVTTPPTRPARRSGDRGDTRKGTTRRRV
jgi:hypothetical protein